jgi:muconolactone delta-isomerase
MRFLAVEKEMKAMNKQDSSELLKSEAKMVWELYQQEIIQEIFFDQERSIAILILETEKKESAENVLAQLPLVKNGYITFELYNLGHYPGYARLFT